jgi:hypothetical protein
MSFAATFNDLSFPEVLHLVSFNRKSGKLTLTGPQGHSLMVFRRGRIIYAASAGLRESFGSLLLCRGLVTDADLMEALHLQERAAESRRLGAILVDMGKLQPQDVKDVLKEQSLRVVREVMQWRKGFFKFEPLEVPEGGEAEVGIDELLARVGVDAEGVLFEAVTQLDEARPETGSGAVTESRGERELRVPPEWETATAAPPLTSLSSIMEEIQAPAFTGEIALGLMRYAAQIVNRGVFLVVRGQELSDVGCFGTGRDGEPAARSGSIRVPLQEPSLFRDVMRKRETYKGPLGPGAWDRRFVELLSGPEPPEVVVIPMVLQEAVAFVFYGDNVPRATPIGPLEGLEFLMIEAGQAMERMAVSARLTPPRRRRSALWQVSGRLG